MPRGVAGRRASRRFGGGGSVAEWTPAELGGLVAWYRETYAAGTWVDLSGNGRHLSQATESARPTQVIRWGCPVLSFDGGDWVRGAFGTTLTQPTTIYSVWESTGTTGAVYDGDGAGNRNLLFLRLTNAEIRPGAESQVICGTFVQDTVYASCVIYNGASSAGYTKSNFATAEATGNMGSQVLDGMTVGAFYDDSNRLTGYVGEVILFAGAHDASARKLVGDYLTARYTGLTVTT